MHQYSDYLWKFPLVDWHYLSNLLSQFTNVLLWFVFIYEISLFSRIYYHNNHCYYSNNYFIPLKKLLTLYQQLFDYSSAGNSFNSSSPVTYFKIASAASFGPLCSLPLIPSLVRNCPTFTPCLNILLK